MGLLRAHLRRNGHASHYALIDAAVLDGVLGPLYDLGRNRFACLLHGALDADVAHVAPYLAAIGPQSALVDFLEARVALPWGYLLTSPLSLRQLHLHLRPFAQTRGPQGDDLVFRFWDPRVLRYMAGILKPDQMEAFLCGILALHLPTVDGLEQAQWDCDARQLRFTGVSRHADV